MLRRLTPLSVLSTQLLRSRRYLTWRTWRLGQKLVVLKQRRPQPRFAASDLRLAKMPICLQIKQLTGALDVVRQHRAV